MGDVKVVLRERTLAKEHLSAAELLEPDNFRNMAHSHHPDALHTLAFSCTRSERKAAEFLGNKQLLPNGSSGHLDALLVGAPPVHGIKALEIGMLLETPQMNSKTGVFTDELGDWMLPTWPPAKDELDSDRCMIRSFLPDEVLGIGQRFRLPRQPQKHPPR